MAFNLVEERWIPVLYADAKVGRVGIREALEYARRIRQIAGSNPLDNVALLRFLLALLLWCNGERGAGEGKRRLRDETEFPADWLSKLLQHKGCFELLGEGKRFYQDKGVCDDLLRAKQRRWDGERKKAKSTKPSSAARPAALGGDDLRPIGDLLVEFPTETKIAHFRHVRDKEYGLCPACCAVGIVRLSTFANAYGYGGRYPAAVNGPAPAYSLVPAGTLLASLIANWPRDYGAGGGEPPWSRNGQPVQKDLNALTVFGWRSRKIWLGALAETERACANCGQVARLATDLAFSGGWRPPFTSTGTQRKFWDGDSHLVLEVRRPGKTERDDEAVGRDDGAPAPRGSATPNKLSAIGFAPPSASAAAHARFWRRVLLALAARASPPDDRGAQRVEVTGPAANKALYQDAACVSLRRPGPVDASALAAISEIGDAMPAALRSATPNPKRRHPTRTAALDALSPSVEARLKEQWNEGGAGGAHAVALEYEILARRVASSTTAGSPVRRREAIRNAEQAARRVVERAARREKQGAAGITSGAVEGAGRRGREEGAT